MSFDKLLKNNFVKKTKVVEVTLSNKEKLKFTASELPYTRKLSISAEAVTNGQDALTLMIVQAITDEDGKKMSYEQAESLPEDIVKLFVEAIAELNPQAALEKKTKRSKSSK